MIINMEEGSNEEEIEMNEEELEIVATSQYLGSVATNNEKIDMNIINEWRKTKNKCY